MTSIKAIRVDQLGGPEVLRFADVPARDPGPGEVRWIGPEPEQAMAVKLGGNHMILGMGELLGEVFRFLRASGIEPSDAKTALMDELLPRVMVGYVERLSADPDSPRPAASAIGRKDNAVLLKDNAVLLKAARKLGVDLKLARPGAIAGR